MVARRPIIAANERGPGPGRYVLPPMIGFTAHDARMKMEPAYSFGRQLIHRDKDGPGPGYFINPSITRHGMDGTPVYSLRSRQRDLQPFKTPCPGAYNSEQVHPQGERIAPRHSMGLRTRYRKCDKNPASSRYNLPIVIGSAQPYKTSAASYSMPGRTPKGSYIEDLANVPGPGNTTEVHPDIYMYKAPHYSLRPQTLLIRDRVQKPGPGAHYPERVKINRQIAPSYSLGVRHTEFVCPLIPAFYE